jgi:hypothetical protein
MSIFKKVNEHSRERIVANKKFLLTNNSDGINSYQLRENSNNISGSYWDSIRALCYFSASTYNSGSGSELWSTKKYGNPYHSIKIKGPDDTSPRYPQHTHKFYSSASIITIPQKYFGEYIQRGTVELIDKSNSVKNIILKDDGRGNLYSSNATDSQSATHASSSDNYIGNVFYNQGLITITDTGSHSGTWDLASATAEKTGPVMSDQNGLPYGFFWKPDGTKYWMIGSTNNKEGIFEYSLSGSAWDVGSAGYTGVSKSYADLGTGADAFRDVSFKPDGTKIYTLNSDNELITEYPLTTAWDILTMNDATSQSFNVESTDDQPYGFYFREDGLKVYMNGIENDKTYEMNMSTAWDITSITSTSQSFATSESLDAGTTEIYLGGITFYPDGTRMYTTGNQHNMVYEHRLSTAWDITTAAYFTSKSVSAEEGNVQGIQWKPDGSKMYVMGWGHDDVNQYNMPSAVFYTDVTTGNFDLSFKSTQTIYVHRIECTVNPNEFNVTNNPTARALDNDNTRKTYKEPWRLTNDLTASGKHWSPYFTTIGLYGEKDIFPVAVARLSQAIKTRDDVTMRFVIRFDQW